MWEATEGHSRGSSLSTACVTAATLASRSHPIYLQFHRTADTGDKDNERALMIQGWDTVEIQVTQKGSNKAYLKAA